MSQKVIPRIQPGLDMQVNLASDFVEAALLPVLPSEQQFPFALRVNCEACSLDGSIAEASVCSTSLALADAGVPLQSLVAGHFS